MTMIVDLVRIFWKSGMGNWSASIFEFCFWICLNLQDQLYNQVSCFQARNYGVGEGGVSDKDNRALIMYRILTSMNSTHTCINKIRFLTNVIAKIRSCKLDFNNGCNYIKASFEHFSNKWLNIKMIHFFQEVLPMMRFDHNK